MQPVTNPREGFELHGRIAKSSQCQPPRNKVQALLPTAPWYQSPRKTQYSQALDGITLYLHREETDQGQLQ